MEQRDHVQRRIVIEYGSRYAYCYMTDGSGKLLEEESFKQPYRMERREVEEEAKDCYAQVWDWLNETVNVLPLQEDGGEDSESGEED